jgi:hypothetical protein
LEIQLFVKGVIVFFKRKWKATVLAVLAAVLGVFLVPSAGMLAVKLSPVLIHGRTPLAANPGVDSPCQAALDAGDKLFTTPYHAFMTESDNEVDRGKPPTHESIFAGGVLYILADGKWNPSGMSKEVMMAMERRNRDNARNMSCHYVRDDSVSGETVALYDTHQETAHGKIDSRTWISKSRGLILRQEIDIDTGRPNGKTHMSARYEYDNVQAPKI